MHARETAAALWSARRVEGGMLLGPPRMGTVAPTPDTPVCGPVLLTTSSGLRRPVVCAHQVGDLPVLQAVGDGLRRPLQAVGGAHQVQGLHRLAVVLTKTRRCARCGKLGDIVPLRPRSTDG